MRYLSQCILPAATALQSGLKDGYAWHKAIWLSFPDRPDIHRDFLFRVDQRKNICRVLLLSSIKPVMTRQFTWQIKEVPEAFLESEIYHFQIKANPTFRRCSDKKRLAIYKEDDLRVWISEKIKRAGAELVQDSLAVSAPMDERFDDGKGGRYNSKKHVAVDFKGILRVKDAVVFKIAFYKGVGSAKGFGYGLLMLQPVRG